MANRTRLAKKMTAREREKTTRSFAADGHGVSFLMDQRSVGRKSGYCWNHFWLCGPSQCAQVLVPPIVHFLVASVPVRARPTDRQPASQIAREYCVLVVEEGPPRVRHTRPGRDIPQPAPDQLEAQLCKEGRERESKVRSLGPGPNGGPF